MREDQRSTVVGLQGSGKTVLTRKLVNDIHKATGRRVLVIDIMDEYKFPKSVATVMRISNKSRPTDELETIIDKLIISPWKRGIAKKKRYAALVIDETPQYWPAGKPLPPNAALINHTMRHMDLGMICISRRFVQMQVDITELSHELFIFRQTGKNDLKRLSEMSEGLDNEVRQLEKYHYVHVDEERKYQTCRPVKLRN